MIDLRARFAAARVLVIGDLMLDEYLFGSVHRISPEAPVPVVDIKSRTYVPGGAANVAANVVSLGARVLLVGICGQDEAGTRLRSVLGKSCIADSWITAFPNRATTSKTRVVAGQQQIVRFDHEQRRPLVEAEQQLVHQRFIAALDQTDVCIFSDYGKGILSSSFCREAIAKARAQNKPVIVDPKGLDYSKYSGCTLITPNLRETGEAVGLHIETESDLGEAGAKLLALLPGSSVLVTRGADGMTLFRPAQPPLTIPTVAQEVFDVVGAGDTAVATLGVALAAGLSLEIGTRLANVAAGVAVGKQGTVAVSLAEVLEHREAMVAIELA